MVRNEVYRGDIYYANLSGIIGSEQDGIRPVVVVQNNIGNYYSPTTIIVPLTKKSEVKLHQPTHYLLENIPIIKYDSIVLAEQVRVIDVRRLRKKIGVLNKNIMKEIDKKLMIALGIENLAK